MDHTGIVNINLAVKVPDNPADAAALLLKVTEEIGSKYSLADTNLPLSWHDVQVLDEEGNYDPSDLAFFMLNNRLFSNTAENALVRIDYDWIES